MIVKGLSIKEKIKCEFYYDNVESVYKTYGEKQDFVLSLFLNDKSTIELIISSYKDNVFTDNYAYIYLLNDNGKTIDKIL